jgi:hypothetical protein
MPNNLGYCGPDDKGTILDHLHDSTVTPALLKKLKGFEAAYPFIELIGRATGRDIFDYSVPEAYWIGNGLLDKVPTEDFYSFAHSRLPNRDPREVKRVFKEAGSAVRPHHTFHVLSTFATSVVSDGPSPASVARKKIEEMVDGCRISWGEVKRVGRDTLIVQTRPVELRGGVFTLGSPASKEIGFDRRIAPFGTVKVGDFVSIHWGFACEILTPLQVRNAERFTRVDIASVNRVLKATRASE